MTLLGLVTLIIAVGLVIKNPHRRDDEVDERLALALTAIDEKRKQGVPLSFEDVALLRARSFN
ncbi:hypothetical protein EBR66_04145 [bacterium]|nr:hypothetical protein [bacterium]